MYSYFLCLFRKCFTYSWCYGIVYLDGAKAGGRIGALGFPESDGENAWAFGNTGALGFPDCDGGKAEGNTEALGFPDSDGANAGALGSSEDSSDDSSENSSEDSSDDSSEDSSDDSSDDSSEDSSNDSSIRGGLNAGAFGKTGALGCSICPRAGDNAVGTTRDFLAGEVRALRFFLSFVGGW